MHKVIHCFDSLIILLYEHPFTIYFDTHTVPDGLFWILRCLALQTRLLIKKTHTNTSLKTKFYLIQPS
jgi:hypothetical protein